MQAEGLTQPFCGIQLAGVGAPRRGAMVVNLSREVRECRLYAEHCADRARLQSDPQLRRDFLEMQRRWLSLARSYEFSERLEFLSAIEAKNKEARLLIEDPYLADP